LLQQEFARCTFNHWEINEPHIDADLEQPREEGNRAGKPVNLGHDQRDLTPRPVGGQNACRYRFP
jgi:hypothetical protein